MERGKRVKRTVSVGLRHCFEEVRTMAHSSKAGIETFRAHAMFFLFSAVGIHKAWTLVGENTLLST